MKSVLERGEGNKGEYRNWPVTVRLASSMSFLETAPDFSDDEQLSGALQVSTSPDKDSSEHEEDSVSGTSPAARSRIADENRKLRHIGAQLFGPAEKVAEYLAAQALYDNLSDEQDDVKKSVLSSSGSDEVEGGLLSVDGDERGSNEEVARSDQSSSLEKRIGHSSYGGDHVEPPAEHLPAPRPPDSETSRNYKRRADFSADELSEMFRTSGWTSSADEDERSEMLGTSGDVGAGPRARGGARWDHKSAKSSSLVEAAGSTSKKKRWGLASEGVGFRGGWLRRRLAPEEVGSEEVGQIGKWRRSAEIGRGGPRDLGKGGWANRKKGGWANRKKGGWTIEKREVGKMEKRRLGKSEKGGWAKSAKSSSLVEAAPSTPTTCASPP